ncbi:DNA damage-inducible transcript 4-like protein-like [Tachysurus ichikawai]
MVYSQALVFGYGLSAGSEEDNLTEMWRKVLQRFRTRKHTVGRLRKTSSSISLESECSLEDDDLEASIQLQQQELAVLIEKCLVKAKASSLHCSELLVPTRMCTRIAGDILRASEHEPCGVRGALIHLFTETQAGLQKVGTVTPEHSLTPTFELSVVFQVHPQRWPPLEHLLGTEKVLRLRPEYRLIKRKLYSSASPTLIEF